ALGSRFAVQGLDRRADHGADLVRLLRRRRLAGADGPDRLVSDDDAPQLFLGHAAERDLRLHRDELVRDALLALLEVLADADDDGEAGVERGSRSLLHGDVGVAEIRS